jgi:hypothetical protein
LIVPRLWGFAGTGPGLPGAGKKRREDTFAVIPGGLTAPACPSVHYQTPEICICFPDAKKIIPARFLFSFM